MPKATRRARKRVRSLYQQIGGARRPAEPPTKTRKVQAMSKIKSTKQFKEQVDAAFATMQTRDEAKACVRGRDAKPLGVYPLDPRGSDP